MQKKADKIWVCRGCATRQGVAFQLPWAGAQCRCGAQPTYLDVLAVLKQQGAENSAESFCLQKGARAGQWWPSEDGAGHMSAMLRCPECGTPAFLYEYEIEFDGLVRPEFGCDAPHCSFGATLRLIGWNRRD